MSTASRHMGQQGFVLVVVLGLLSTLFIMALSLGAVVRSDLAQSRRFQDDTAAEFIADGGIEWVIHILNKLARQNMLWQTSWRDQPAQFRDRRLGAGTFDVSYVDTDAARRYGLQDEEARINLNRAPSPLLAGLPGFNETVAQTIVTQRQQQPLITPDELVERGMVSPLMFYGTADQTGVAPYVTVWGSGKININTAPLPVLMALPGITPGAAKAILRYRQGDDRQMGTPDDGYFRTVDDLLQMPEIDRSKLDRFGRFLTVTPTVFRTIVTGRVPSGQDADRVYQRFAILDRTSPSMQILYWRRLE